MTPGIAAIALGALAAAFGIAAEVRRRDDRYDRTKKGRLWVIGDRDGWAMLGYAATAIILGLAALAAALIANPAIVTIVVASTAVLTVMRRRPRPRRSAHGRVVVGDGREQIVYAVAGYHPTRGTLDEVGIGITIRGAAVRIAERDDREQTSHVYLVATGPGGRQREADMHARLDAFRFRTRRGGEVEWFDATPEVIEVIGELEQREAREWRRMIRAAQALR